MGSAVLSCVYFALHPAGNGFAVKPKIWEMEGNLIFFIKCTDGKIELNIVPLESYSQRPFPPPSFTLSKLVSW